MREFLSLKSSTAHTSRRLHAGDVFSEHAGIYNELWEML